MRVTFIIAALCCFTVTVFGQSDTSVLAKYEKDLEANSHSSITHFHIAGIRFQQGAFQAAGNEFREALLDATGQRDRAINEYIQAQRTKDNTWGALDEAATYFEFPYPRK